MKQAAMYVRVSTDHQKEEATIESQKIALLQFAKEQGYEIPTQLIFSDNGVSGAILARPALDKLRDFSAEGIFNCLFILSPDRLSRKYAHQIIIIEELKKHGVQIRFKSSPPSESPEGTLLEQMQSMFAEYERAQIVERTRRGKAHKARNGHVSVLATAPFGYKYISGTTIQSAHFEIDDREAQIVRTIFNLYVQERMSARQIINYLYEHQIPSPKGNPKWSVSSIMGLLRASTYRGIAYFGVRGKVEPDPMRLPNRRVRLNGRKWPRRASKERNPSEWIPISVPAIISNEVFEIAQSLRKRNIALSERNTKQKTLLQGLVSCKECGYGFTSSYSGKKAEGNVYYRCNNPDRKDCKNRGMRVDQLDKAIWNEIIAILDSPELIHREISKRLSEFKNEPAQERERQLRKKIVQLEQESNRLLDAFQEGCVELTDLKIRMGIIKREMNNTKREISREVSGISQEQLLEIKTAVQYFSDRLKCSQDKLSIEEKRKVLRILVKEIQIGIADITINHILPCDKINVHGQNAHLCSDRPNGE